MTVRDREGYIRIGKRQSTKNGGEEEGRIWENALVEARKGAGERGRNVEIGR